MEPFPLQIHRNQAFALKLKEASNFFMHLRKFGVIYIDHHTKNTLRSLT